MEPRVRIATILAGLSILAVPLLAQRDREAGRWRLSCDDNSGSDEERARFCEIRTTGFKATGARITVGPGENGAIRVSGWDRDSVGIAAKVQTQARNDADAAALAREIRIEASGGTIRAVGPATGRRQSWSVSFDVSVPRSSDLSAETVNGPIAVTGVSGRMELTAENGPLNLESVGGDVRARTTNGPLVVTLDGEKWQGAGLDAETHNGPVVLTLPERYAAHLVAGTVNGPMHVDYPVTVQGRINFRRLETDIGGGGPTIRALTTNGPVSIRRD